MRLHSRRGIALIAALGRMTLLGLMVAGAFAASVLGERSVRLTQSDAQLTAGADYAINTVLGDWRANGLADLPLGQAHTFSVTLPDAPNVHATVNVTRLPAGVLWLVGDVAIAGVDQGHRRVNVVARFPSLGATPPAGVVARGNVVARDSVGFSADTSGDADCAVSNTANSMDVVTSPGATASVVDTSRAVALSVAADSATYYMKARQLAMLDSMPGVAHVRGDTTIAGGSFSGILFVDGSITVTGPFTVAGLVVARGSISAITGGFSLSGAMMAFGNPTRAGTAIELARATIRYAPCVVLNSVRRNDRPRPVIRRNWAELF
jgi:hypothetical protein